MAKKFLSLVLALSMVLSLGVFSAFAEDAEATVDEAVQAVADAITAEMLTQDNEPSHLVTKNLDMSLEGDIELPDGVSVTFASSDTSLIANDGTVTRTSTYDGYANIIATVSKEGSASVTKELPITVLKTETTVLMSDNFYYPEMKDGYVVEPTTTGKAESKLSGWSYYNFSSTTKIEENVETKIKSLSDGYAIDYKRLNEANGATVNVKKTFDITAADTDVISLNMTNHLVDWGNGTKRIDMILYANTTAGVKKFGEIRFSNGSTSIYTYNAETAAFTSTYVTTHKLAVGSDSKVEIKIDYAKKTYAIFINGSQAGITANIPDYTYTEKLDYITMDIIRQNLAPAEMYIKDVSVTSTAVSGIRYEEITTQSPNAITQNLNLPTEVGGKEIVWTSSNPDVIAEDGTVTRDRDEHDVTLTANINGEEPMEFNFSVLSDRIHTKYWVSSENFEGVGAYKTIWGTGNGAGNGAEINGTRDANLTFNQVVVDKGEDGGVSRVLYMHRANEDQEGTCYGLAPLYKVASVNGKNSYTNGLITIKANLCFDFNEGETPKYSVKFYERGNAGDMGDKVVFNYATNKITVGAYTFAGLMPERGEWFDLEIMIDTKREMMEVFVDGVSVVGQEMELNRSSDHDYYGTKNTGVSGISGIYFNCINANTGMYVDNLALYAINDEEYYSDVAEYGMYTNKEPVTDYDFSLAVVGDIQKTTYHYPDKLSTIYKWIADNAEDKNIVRAVTLGDVTEKDTVAEYDIAKDAFSALDGIVPHTIVRGNHDVAKFDANIPYAEYKDTIDGSYGESMKNTYNLFTAGGRKYMMLNLDCGAKPDMLQWANEVVAAHPDYNVIVATHLYTNRTGRTIDTWYGVTDYGQTGGTTIWNDFVKQHENIKLVLCGHVDTDNILVTKRQGVHGNTVTEMLINPQTIDQYYEAAGLVAMLYFSEDGSEIQVEYYSTTYEAFYKKNNQLTVEVEVVEPSEGLTITASNFSQTATKATIDIAMSGDAENDILVAVYNADKKLIAVKKYDAQATVNAELDITETVKYVKVFCVDAQTLVPECTNAEMEI